MEILNSLDERAASPSVATIGSFAVVHRGHAQLLHSVSAAAASYGAKATVVTFDRHPLEVVRPERAPCRLANTEQRLADFAANGVERVLMIPFNESIAAMTPVEFVDALVDCLKPVQIIVGADFRFGHDRAGSVETLIELGPDRGFGARAHDLVADSGSKISTSHIRALINEGQVSEAASLLGRNHRVAGHVVHGDKFGAKMGFPTANVAANGGTCIPASGIYAGRWHHEGIRDGVIYIGDRSTVSDAGKIGVEIHIFDFEGDLYGVSGEVEFVSRIRADRHFDSVDELVIQMTKDTATAREILATPTG